jgi:hypothetical protein
LRETAMRLVDPDPLRTRISTYAKSSNLNQICFRCPRQAETGESENLPELRPNHA